MNLVEETVPYTESISNKSRIRVFLESVNDDELKWHVDQEDRIVKILESNNWFLQMDNQLPKELISGQTYEIPKETYHRVIKGNGNLKVEITFK